MSSSNAIADGPRSRPGSKFNYSVAASYIAKDKPYDPATHLFHFSPYHHVGPPKRGKGKAERPESGQDAFFVSRVGDSGAVALGIADGVGGWMNSGVDPADFSHALCDYMAAAAARTMDGTLEVANLGDSGFVHLRLNAVHAASTPQTHAFNTPFQLSVVPPVMLLRAAAFGGGQLMDQPRDAKVTRHDLRHGDVLIFASDGLWDNLFNQDILRIVSHAMVGPGAWATTEGGVTVAPDLKPFTQPDTEPGAESGSGTEATHAPSSRPQRPRATLQSMIASRIVGAAKAASVNKKLDGPFAKEVKRYYPHERWYGGKVDDICVVTVVVSSEEAAPEAKL
ncbi:hypothetical protein P8C59_007409 [Phyllachora maydis]|uniref:Protein phosphatase n=1 Tax=Phyllachora maydis TaxID=1825666 RepID=A0AAD9IA63_9PEZI|nr:hypothetical protein P8C59_007409 [Phyllachora maydis]